MTKLAFLLFLLFVAALATDRLISIQVIFRHGARYPYEVVKNDEVSQQAAKNNMLRELTSEGKHQHYLLGKSLYHRYWKKLFEGTKFQSDFDQSLIDAFSTNTNRTIQSAESLMEGLLQDLSPEKLPFGDLTRSLPPFPGAEDLYKNHTKPYFYVYGEKGKHFHNVPVHTEPNLQKLSFSQKFDNAGDNLHIDYLVKIVEGHCPIAKEIVEQNMHSKIAQRIRGYPIVKEFFRRAKKELGYEINLDYQGSIVCDSYEVNKYLSAPTLKVFQDPEMRRVEKLLRFAYQILEDSYTPLQQKISATWLLQELIKNMKLAVQNKGPRINLLSTHDWTLIVVLGALKFYTLECIEHSFLTNTSADDCITEYTGFASHVVFELWETSDLSYEIKIMYNGIQKKIPVCGNKDSCSLKEFQAWAQTLYVDPNSQCHIAPMYFSTQTAIQKKMENNREVENKEGIILILYPNDHGYSLRSQTDRSSLKVSIFQYSLRENRL